MIVAVLVLSGVFLGLIVISACHVAGKADEAAGYKTPGKRSRPKRMHAVCEKCGWVGWTNNTAPGPSEWHLPHEGCNYSAIPMSPERESFMGWLRRKVQADPIARRAARDEARRLWDDGEEHA